MSTVRTIAAYAATILGLAVLFALAAGALSVLAMALFSGPWWAGPAFLAVFGALWAIGAGAVWLIQWGGDVLEARRRRDDRRADGWARWDR